MSWQNCARMTTEFSYVHINVAAGATINKWKRNPGLLFLLHTLVVRRLNRILWVCVDAGCRGYSPLKGTFSNKQRLLVCFLQPSLCSDVELASLC